MKIHTDEAQPKNDSEVSKAMAKPKGMGADRQPEPNLNPDGLSKGKYSPRTGSPRN